MALRQGRDTDSNPESRGAFPPLLIVFYPRRGKAFPSKEGFLYCGIPPFGRIKKKEVHHLVSKLAIHTFPHPDG